MKRLACLLLALAVLLPCAGAAADPEEWDYHTTADYTIRYPGYIDIYGVPEEETGWNMEVLEDPEGTSSTGSTVGIFIVYAGEDDWTYWLKRGSFPDERGHMEKMRRETVDEPPVDPDTGMETSYALFRSLDGARAAEAFIFDAEGEGLDYVVVCRYPADDGGEYSDVLHWMMETLTFTNTSGPSSGTSGAPSGIRGSFLVTDVWEYDGYHTVIKDVVVDKTSAGMYWIYVNSDVTKFKVEKLTWNDRTFKVKKARQLYSRKTLTTRDVIAIHDWLPEILPTVRIRAVNADGEEEVWYISTNEEDGSIILLSEEDVAY